MKPTDNTLPTSNEPGRTYNGYRLLNADEIAAIVARVDSQRLATNQVLREALGE